MITVENFNSNSIHQDKNDCDEGQSMENDGKTYFDKLRSIAMNRLDSRKIKGNIRIRSVTSSVNVLEDLIESMRSSPSTADTQKNQSQIEWIKQISFDNGGFRSFQREYFVHHTRQPCVNSTFSINTQDGTIFFDFSKQSIDYRIYLYLMQLVRSSNLDKLIEKIFHKSGEYHHVDYKENRRHQIEKDHQCLSTNMICCSLISMDLNKTNRYLTMSKAVHFRNFTKCFVLEGIDISSRFQYDRKVIKDVCHRFYVNTSRENNMKCQIIVLCTHRMREVYRLFQLLFKSYISLEISIIYVTFDQMEVFLRKDKSTFDKTPFKNETINENNTMNLSSEQIPLDDIDSFNEEYLLNCFRTCSLLLIFMKHLDEFCLTKLIQWYKNDFDLSVTTDWNGIFKHWWLITSDYQRAEIIFNISRNNLFLWPIDHNTQDYLPIIISSILALPIALTINYQNYSMIIDGMSIIDRHCQQTTIEENLCIRMALLRIWSSISHKKCPTIVINDDDNLQYFKEYVEVLLTEYEETYENRIADRSTMKALQEEYHCSYDIIQIHGMASNSDPIDQILCSQSSILIDQLTPLTLGALMGVYQILLFFEYIIRQNCDITLDLNLFHIKK